MRRFEVKVPPEAEAIFNPEAQENMSRPSQREVDLQAKVQGEFMRSVQKAVNDMGDQITRETGELLLKGRNDCLRILARWSVTTTWLGSALSPLQRRELPATAVVAGLWVLTRTITCLNDNVLERFLEEGLHVPQLRLLAHIDPVIGSANTGVSVCH